MNNHNNIKCITERQSPLIKLIHFRRNDFLNKDAIANDMATLKDNKPIHFLPNDIMEDHAKHNGHNTYHVVIAGILPSGLKTVVTLRTEPYFLIRVPDEYLHLDVLNTDHPANAYALVETFKDAIRVLFREHGIYAAENWETQRRFQSDGFQLQKDFTLKFHFIHFGKERKQYSCYHLNIIRILVIQNLYWVIIVILQWMILHAIIEWYVEII